MYKELVIRNVVIIALSLILFFFLSLFVVNFVNRRNLESQLQNLSAVISNSLQKTNSEREIMDVVNSYTKDQQWLNVVIATSLGDIIIDSSVDTLTETGVLPRLEQFEMEKLGVPGNGGTVYVNNGRIFYIERLNDDVIFRTSIAMEDSTNYMLLGMFILMVVLMAVLLISIWMTGKTSSRVTDAFDNIYSHLRLIANGENKKISENHRYGEVALAYSQINAVNDSIFQYIKRISAERDKLNHIIENINEGIVIIGVSGNIYTINRHACSIFGVDGRVKDQPYEQVITDPKFAKRISDEITTKSDIRFDYVDARTANVYLVSLNYFKNKQDIDEEDLISIVLYDVTTLRREERIKADFIANASHELKTPITSISGFSELLLSGLVPLPDNIVEYVANIHSESVRMKNTVEDLLYLSKLDYSEEISAEAEVDLAELAASCVKNYRQAAREKGVELKTAGQSAVVKGDYSLLSHMLGNLLDNAVKYSARGGTVTVETGVGAEGKKFIKVSDTGCGIQPQHVAKLFDRFYRVDNSRNRDTGGTGLGLTIAQRICVLHGAKISVESTFGEGTAFTVEFEKAT